MENTVNDPRKIFLINGAALGWVALVLQFYLIIVNRTATVTETIIRYFSFFTISTNILVAVCLTYLLVKPHSKWGSFFSRPATQTAIAVYIAVVGIIYNVILRFLWAPTGLNRVADELLHSVVPVLFMVYWLFFVPKETLLWKNILPWLIYPAVYCIYTLIRGEIAGYYPYPFMDVISLGYNSVLVNIVGVVIVFVVISLLLVGIAKLAGKSAANQP